MADAKTIWRGHLSFGLVSFPIRLYTAARPAKVPLRRLYRAAAPEPEAPIPSQRRTAPEPAPAGEAEVFRTANRVVAPSLAHARPAEPASSQGEHGAVRLSGDFTPPASELVKGYEYEKGRYAVLENHELEGLAPETSREMEILEFVRLEEIDPIYFETSYYLRPEEAGQRPYGLIFEALREAEKVGLARFAMHRREHIVVVRPGRAGLIAHTMFYPSEIGAGQECTADTNDLQPRELDLAKRLIDTMTVPFDPSKFRDTYQERLQELIEAKVAGRQVARETVAAPRQAQVIDIFEALEKSLAAMKKPQVRAPSASKRRARKSG